MVPAFQYAQAADEATAVGSDTTSIDALAIRWVTNAAMDSDGAYVQEAISNSTNPEKWTNYKAHFEYALSGNSDHAPGTVEIRIPASIFTARDGSSKADKVTLSIPQAPTVPTEGDFNYTYDKDTDEYVITNCKTVGAASKTSFEVTYAVTHASDVVDMQASKPLSAKLKVTAEDGTVHKKQSASLTAKLDTQAKLSKAYKSVYQMSRTYPDGWGEAPADAGDYFYVIWNYQISIPDDNTQPWTLSLSDVLGDNTGSIVGYRASGSTTRALNDGNALDSYTPTGKFSTVAPTWTKTDPSIYLENCFGSVLTRYPKSLLDDGESHTFTNSVTGTLTGTDDGIASTATADASYTYKSINFSLPPGKQSVRKYYNPRSEGGINLIEEGQPAPFTGAFRNEANVNRYDLTFKDGGDASNPDDYGKKPYTVELIDDAMFLDGDYDRELTAQDAVFASCNVTAWFYDYVADEMKGEYVEQDHADAATKPDIELWGKFGTDEWVKIETLKPTSGAAYTPEGSTSSTIALPDGCTGLKAVCTSSFYRVNLYLEVTPKLLPSDRVKSLVSGGADKYYLQNWNTLRVLDADGSDQATTSYLTGSQGRDRVGERDKELYGTGLLHGTATAQITPFTKSSSMSKTTVSARNDPANRRILLEYLSEAYESISYTSGAGLDGEKLVEMGMFEPQRTGTFYDLLPMGVEPDLSSIRVQSYLSYAVCNIDSVETIENYNGTGRTLLIVKASLPEGAGDALYDDVTTSGGKAFSGFRLRFNAYYSWDDYIDYGQTLLNSIAYETGNEKIAGGYADTGGRIKEHDLLADLNHDGNPEGTPSTFLYAQTSRTINVNVSAAMDLTKRVKGPESTSWTDGQDGSVVVGKGEGYSYRLRSGAASGSSLTGIVLYDSLENYHPANGGGQWRGVLESVDTSQLEKRGIAPTVYYSTVPELSIEDHEDLADASVWSTTPPDDLSKVTAIAIDCSKAKDGSEFTLTEGNTVVALVHMRAPDDDTYGPAAEAEAHAYNNVYLKSVLHNSLDGTISDQTIHNEFTQVGLKKAAVQPLPSLGWLGSWLVAAAGALLAAIAAAALAYARHTRGRHSIARRGEAPQAK